MPKTLRVDTADGIATVSITRPTMPPIFFQEVGEAFEAIDRDPGARVAVLRSECKPFSYGLDLPATFGELGPLLRGGGLAAPRTELIDLIRRWQRWCGAPATIRKPVIAAIHGWCIGGGLDLTSACDVRLCTTDTKFSLREAKLAIVADLGSLQRLTRIIGDGHVRELAYTAKDIDAARAKAIGLVNDVFESRDAVHAAAQAMAQEIAANPPLTVQGIKQVLAYGDGKTVAEGLEYVATWNAAFVGSEDLAEAAAAFMGKRTPKFTGK